MSNHDQVQLYIDLKGFLESPRTDLRREATKAILACRVDICIEHKLLPALVKNVHFDDLEVQLQALKGLVYLSADPQALSELIEANTISRLVEIVLEHQQKPAIINQALAVLANLTRSEEGAVEFVGKTFPDEAVKEWKDENRVKPSLEVLFSRFQQPYKEGDYENDNANDPYQHFAAILLNITQIESGRKFLMRIIDNKSRLQDILVHLKSPNTIRRRGIAGTIRNCCLDKDSSWWLLNIVKLTTPLLYPLAGPEDLDPEEKVGLDPDLWLEGPDKVREPDHQTRLFLVEAILLLLSSSRKNREFLRLSRVYVILKWCDMVEEMEDVSECINECVQYLRRDEEGTHEGSSDQMVADAYAARRATTIVNNMDDVD